MKLTVQKIADMNGIKTVYWNFQNKTYILLLYIYNLDNYVNFKTIVIADVKFLKFKFQYQYQDQQCISGIENLIISKFNSQKRTATLKMKWNAVITESSLFQYK